MPSVDEAFSLAMQHHQAGRLEIAQQLYSQILAAQPHHAECHHLLGIVAYQRGHYEEAIASIRRALALNSSAAPYYSNLGLAQEALSHLEDAATSYLQALRLQPSLAEPHCNIANTYLKMGKLGDAVSSYRHALDLKPNYAEAHHGLGLALAGLGQLEEAVQHYRQALKLEPSHAEANTNLATAFLSLGRLDEAARCYQQALRLKPNDPMLCNNVGVAFTGQEKHEGAAKWYREAIRLNPHFTEAYYNLGNALERQGKFYEALQCYDEILRHPVGADPTLVAKAHWIRSVLWLQLGNFKQGWPEFEWRWSRPGIIRRPFVQPVWDGSRLNGRTILLYAEQGLGDTLQFIRYAPIVAKPGSRVVFECQPALLPLLAGAPGIDDIFAVDCRPPHHDIQAALLSLPRILDTAGDTIPASVPYLQADARLVEHWRQVLQPLPGFKVGITWQGSPAFSRDRQRSIALACFEALAKVQGVQLISLQKGHGTEQLGAIANRFPVMDLSERLDEACGAFVDTAAAMKSLDLVITSDTAIPHLAGALGVPVWLALPIIPDWRWLLERHDSPWYPTMRLFRQARLGRWDDVFERLAAELKLLLANSVR